MQHIKDQDINSLIYFTPLKEEPSRYELFRYSTWRIYFYQEIESMSSDRIDKMKSNSVHWTSEFPQLVTTDEEQQYYGDLLNDIKLKTYREDIISHFGCRLLYCHDNANHAKFIEMEKLLLNLRLRRKLSNFPSQVSKQKFMNQLKKMLAHFLQKNVEELNLPEEDWKNYSHKIMHNKNETIYDYAKIPMEIAQIGLRKRYCFVRKGSVYLTVQCMVELVQNYYGSYLKNKLQRLRIPVIDMLNSDMENQMSGFIRKTVQIMNSTNFDDTVINNQHKLTLKNVDMLWKKFFPPCMQFLNKKLKDNNHLKHEGRRQLWLFFKGCGMDANQNVAYFQKHFASKVSNSDLKAHIYNIQHAYGLVGKKQPERPKNCRNIITGPAPKKDQYHGCPFAHWKKEELKEFLKRNYEISQENLEEVMRQKEQNHFQVACGRLFEGVAKAQGVTMIPPQITNVLGKSPHEYFLSRMQLVNMKNKAPQDKKMQKMLPQVPQVETNAIEF